MAISIGGAMTNFAELRRRAEEARDGAPGLSNEFIAFMDEATPDAVIELLDELDAARAQLKSKPAKRNDYPADFESAWSAYPPRPGANKVSTFKAWSARVKAGALPADILAGVERYAAYVMAERTEERFIKQPATFMGPDEHFALPWKSSRGAASRREVSEDAKRRLFGGFDEFGGTNAQG